MAKAASSCPSSTSRSRTSRATSTSRATHEPPPDDGLDDPVGSRSGRAQALDLVGVLDRPQLGDGLGRQPERGTVQSRLEPERVHGPEVVREQEPAGRGIRWQGCGDAVERVVRLGPGDDLDQAALGGRRSERRRPLQARHDQGRRPIDRQHEHGQALERQRRVAGQPAELRADADEEGRSAAIADRLPRGVDALAEASRRHGHADVAHGTPAGSDSSQRSTTPGPSS